MSAKDRVGKAANKVDAVLQKRVGNFGHTLSLGELFFTILALIIVGYGFWKDKPHKERYVALGFMLIAIGEVVW